MVLAAIIVVFLNIVLGLTFISSISEMKKSEKIGCAIAQSVLIAMLIVIVI